MESKRRKISNLNQKNNENLDPDLDLDIDLLPGLPNHLAQVCLSLVNPSTLFPVCRTWRNLIYAPPFPPFLSLYALLSNTTNSLIQLHTFDPISAAWRPLPPPPPPPIRLLLRHPSFLSRNLPIQSLSVGGKLLVLAATGENLAPALPRPLVFDPAAARWADGPPLSAPRRWCAVGALGGSAYVASGVGGQFSHQVARSVERWGGGGGEMGWEKVSDLKDSRFSRDAIEAVGWRGKLCMVNVRGGGVKDGVVYDLGRGAWEEMPPGMIGGWRGPAAAMDEEEMYAVDEEVGVLRRYVEERDGWEEVARSESLKGAEQMAARGGKVCVVSAGGKGIVVVDVTAAESGRTWEVEPLPGLDVVAVHVLPRMNIPASF